MSTFKGIVEEFPEIRIDYFRTIAGRTPPLAGFLSHVHSDHLLGLESLKAPFIYCSWATRQLLLRLEKYPHRMNFAKGILESRKQHYRHLRNLLKPIPLNAPTEIELCPGKIIQVTLLDANHCAGAVMFLIEDSAKAILYTGDIRSEPWFVNALIRNPVVIPYSHGHRMLDKIYLDTTFASKADPNRNFPTKADGLKELLDKVMMYPKETIFHFHAWTPGYEEVWIALASALHTRIHVDRYKMELYGSLAPASSGTISSSEGHILCGFKYGNREQAGCLTTEHTVRLHSCERGTSCPTLETSAVVWITPIISRSSEGLVIPEVGAGGGEGDLTQAHELELSDPKATLELMRLCLSNIHDKKIQERTLTFLSSALSSHRKCVSLDALGLEDYNDSIPLERLTELLAKIAEREEVSHRQGRVPHNMFAVPKTVKTRKSLDSNQKFPRSIQFPYSRHSSYDELCHLVQVFKPVDVYPCTVDEDSWTWDVSIGTLFGHLCFGTVYSHDKEMGLLKGNEVASLKDMKRRRDESSSQDYPGSSTEEDVDSNWENDQNATLAEPTGSDRIRNNTYAVPVYPKRPRKRSRTSQESIKDPIQCPTPRMSLASNGNSSKCLCAGPKGADGPRKIDNLRNISQPNHLAPKREMSDLRSSFEGWLKTRGSKTKPVLAQGDADPTLQLTDELSTAASTTTRRVGDETRSARFSAKPSLIDRTIRTEYPCRWQMCSETFDLLPKLRQHVFQNHQHNGQTGLSLGHTCLWGRCSRPSTPAYCTEELWKDHLDKFHGLNRSRRRSKGKYDIDKNPEPISQASRANAYHTSIDWADDTHDPHPDPLQHSAGTQAHPISLSSQATSTSATGSSLFQTNNPRIDGYEVALDHEPAPKSQDSQLSVSTSAFGSQTYHQLYTYAQNHTAEDYHPSIESQPENIWRRKEAYRAAKGMRGLGWGEVDMVSSSGGHGEPEMEL